MEIPRIWIKESADSRFPDGRTLPVTVWGWGETESGARRLAADRLQRVLLRIGRAETFPDRYAYGSRPLREEILQVFERDGATGVTAMLTRNGYGAQVLNTDRLLFLDIDVPRPTLMQRLLRGFRGPVHEEKVLNRLRDTLQQYGRATFRVYRTAAGFRAMAIDREFDPAGREARELMQTTGTDPAFARLCQVQRSFRARLTPKPWRCRMTLPPGQHPRSDDELRERFASWLGEYESASLRYATCRYLETIGRGQPTAAARPLLELHDRLTRCDEQRPLA